MSALILFDFDGTLADTAPDLAAAANRQRTRKGLEPMPYEALRPVASQGARGLLRVALGLKPGDADYEPTRLQFLEDYAAESTVHSKLFPGIVELLAGIRERGLSWGIVTNKVTYLTLPIVEFLDLTRERRAGLRRHHRPRQAAPPAPATCRARGGFRRRTLRLCRRRPARHPGRPCRRHAGRGRGLWLCGRRRQRRQLGSRARALPAELWAAIEPLLPADLR